LNFLVGNEELLLVHRQMPKVSRKKQYDLMLTPQFYIFKKEDLPIKYQFQATKLAPSVLDDLLGDGAYSYAAIKEDDGWVFMAYDIPKIESFLEEKGLSANNINKIYFAQQSKEGFEFPIEIDDNDAITTINDTVTILPKNVIGTDEFAMFTNKFRPSQGFSSVSSRSTFVSQKQAWIVSGILLALAGTYFAEGIRYQGALSDLDVQLEDAASKYPSLSGKGSLALDNMFKTRHTLDTKQREIRQTLKNISLFASKDTKLDNLMINAKGYATTFSPGKQTIAELKKLAKDRGLKVKDVKGSFALEGGL